MLVVGVNKQILSKLRRAETLQPRAPQQTEWLLHALGMPGVCLSAGCFFFFLLNFHGLLPASRNTGGHDEQAVAEQDAEKWKESRFKQKDGGHAVLGSGQTAKLGAVGP